nr:hypothetical protein [Tanacetum cinerariifolium]
MKDVFVSVVNDLNKTLKQNELLKDRLLEASLAEDIKNLVITYCAEIRNKDLHDETERISKESKDVSNESKTSYAVCNDAFEVTQELSKRIVELEKDLSKFEAKSIGGKRNLFEKKTRVFQIKIDELEKSLAKQKKINFGSKVIHLKKTIAQNSKDFDDVNLKLSNRTAKFEAYFEKLKNKKVILERQLARKNVVPFGDLTCLFPKASIDESNLWHRRLGHVNFKTINKLVKENLVRGLPSKTFENYHTCVACQKEAVNIACYVLNKALVTKTHNKTPYELLNGGTRRLDFMRPFGYHVTILNTLDPLGKFEGNRTNKNAGPQDTNGNAGTLDNVDTIVLPLWSSISSTFKSSDDKATDDKPTDDTGSKTIKVPVNKEDQAYIDEFDRLMSQEKEASDAVNALRYEFEQGCIDQRGVTNSGSTNSFNTVSHSVNAACTSRTFSAARPLSPHLDSFIPTNTLLHIDIFDSPVQSVDIEADFNNVESSTIVSPIPTYKVHLDHPKDQILGDPKSAVQARGIAKKSSGAHALYDSMLVHVYVDDIIFGSTKKSLFDEFEALLHKRFQMSSIGELTLFLGLQVKQSEEGIFISKDKYIAEILKKFDFSYVKITSTPIETQNPLVKDEEAANVTLKLTHLHDVKRIFRKSTTGGCQFLGRRLISWQCKKQTIVATSTTEAEYLAAANCYGQVRDAVYYDLKGDRPRCQKTTLGDTDAQTRFETASKQSHDLPFLEVNTFGSGEDSMKHQDDLTNGSCLGGSKDYSRQSDNHIEIESQEARKKRKARTLQPMKRRLFKGRIETSTDKGLGEDASKQGRNDDKTEKLNLTDGADTEVLVEDKGSGEKGGSTDDQVSTARPETLIKLRSEKAKKKGVAFRDVEEPPRLTRSTTTLQPLLTIDPKDKGKGILVEEESEKLEKVKRKDQGLAQIESYAELAQRIYEEELTELDRAQKERQKQKGATIAALNEEFD